MGEIWKDIKGYEGLYQISNLGRIKSSDRELCNSRGVYVRQGRVLKNGKNQYGYFQVSLYKDGKRVNKQVHKLIAIAFIPNTNNYKIINHIDGNRQNNNINNLEWCTQKHNVKEAYRLGLVHKKYKPVNQYDLKNNFIKTWESIVEVNKVLKIDKSSIVRCCKGKQNKAGNYIWRYES